MLFRSRKNEALQVVLISASVLLESTWNARIFNAILGYKSSLLNGSAMAVAFLPADLEVSKASLHLQLKCFNQQIHLVFEGLSKL